MPALTHQTCSCHCGQSTFEITSSPFARFLCHCTICQSVYRAPFADVTVLWAKNVSLTGDHKVQFKKHRRPPAVSRGTCASCNLPVVGFLTVAPLVRLALIPSRNYPESYALPPVMQHIFYHSRTADVSDHLPKHSGYWRSEWAVTKLVFGTAFGRAAEA